MVPRKGVKNMSISPKRVASIKLARKKLMEALEILEKAFDHKHYDNMISLTEELVSLFKDKGIFNGDSIKENMLSSAILILGLLDKMFSGDVNEELKNVIEKISFTGKFSKRICC